MTGTRTLRDVDEAELYDMVFGLQVERDARVASVASAEADVDAVKQIAAEQQTIANELWRRYNDRTRPARAAALTAEADAIELPPDTRPRKPTRGLMPTHPFTGARGRQLVVHPPTSAQ
jgi:hypothetical protein